MRLRLNGADYFETPRDWSLSPARTRAWRDFDLWFLVAGRGRLLHDAGETTLLPGTCLLLRGGEAYTFQPDSPRGFRHYWAHFDYLDRRGRAVPPARAAAPPLARRFEDPRFLEMTFERLARAARTGEDGTAWLRAALAEVEAEDRRQSGPRPRAPRDVDVWVDELCDLVRRRPEKDWTIAAMARELGMSRSYFYKVFLRRALRAPQRFVAEERMRRARTLLRESANAVGWIAETLGYGDVYQFSHQFKTFHGVSPRAFRAAPSPSPAATTSPLPKTRHSVLSRL